MTRGLQRCLRDLGFASVREVTPRKGLRLDLMAAGADGEIWGLEVKSGLADLRADQKWGGYLEWCDRFFFGVGAAFPLDALPGEHGVFRADAYGAEMVRPSALRKLAPARRKALMLKLARHAALRLQALEEPPLR